MIKNVQQSDGLEEVKVKLNEVIKILVWENPTATVEKVAKEYLTNHNRQIAKTRDELKTTLVEVKTALDSISTANENVEGCRKDVIKFMTETEENISSYKIEIQNNVDEFKSEIKKISKILQDKIKQFISFYAQVGLHVKELCDGKK